MLRTTKGMYGVRKISQLLNFDRLTFLTKEETWGSTSSSCQDTCHPPESSVKSNLSFLGRYQIKGCRPVNFDTLVRSLRSRKTRFCWYQAFLEGHAQDHKGHVWGEKNQSVLILIE